MSYNEENVQRYIEDSYCGVVNSNGFWKEFLNGMAKIWSKKYVSKLSNTERILLVAGKDDPVGQCGKGILSLQKQYINAGITSLEMKIYDNMRHEILNEDNKTIVYSDILNFLLS